MHGTLCTSLWETEELVGHSVRIVQWLGWISARNSYQFEEGGWY